MALINKNISNLIGGVSQQAPALRLYNQAERQENCFSSLANGLQSRLPIKYIGAGGASKSAFYPIDRDDSGRYNLYITPSGLQIFDDEGVEQTVSHTAGYTAYLAAAGDYDPYRVYKVLTLADQTFVLNTTKVTALSSATYTAWKNQALVFIKQVNYVTTWALTIDDVSRSFGYGGQENDGTVKRYINGVQTGNTDGSISATEVASQLYSSTTDYTYTLTTDTVYNPNKTYYKLTVIDGYVVYTGQADLWDESVDLLYERTSSTVYPFSGFTITQVGATLWIRKTTGASFTIGLSDSRSDTCSTLITSKVQQFDQLPTVAPDGYICRVVGAVSSNADDYYVQFVANSGTSFGKGVWEECAEPGTQYAIDASLMPWVLRHTTATGWTFSPAAWDSKTTGDTDSNPIPPFIGKRLRNIFLFRNRLCFIAEDLLCMSAAADYENWWNETAFTLNDSDPIYLSASTERLADLYDFGILNDSLIIFGNNDQYELSTPDTLSPKTAALLPVSGYAYTKGTGVVSAGNRIFFGNKTGDWFKCHEYGINTTTGKKDGISVTSHVPTYIPFRSHLQITGSADVSVLAVLSQDDPSALYIYQYYISNASKLQSAWHKYTIKNGEIKSIFFRENILWMHIMKGVVSITATLDFAERAVDDPSGIRLDLNTTLQHATATDTWTLPSYITSADAVVLGEIGDIITPLYIKERVGQVITLEKAVTRIYVGESYNALYKFSTQYPQKTNRDGSTTSVTSGRFQLQTLTVNHETSGSFTVTVVPEYDRTAEGFAYHYTGITIGQQNSILASLPSDAGEFKVPLRGRNTELAIQISSDSWLPFSFISAEFQGSYITKVRNI